MIDTEPPDGQRGEGAHPGDVPAAKSEAPAAEQGRPTEFVVSDQDFATSAPADESLARLAALVESSGDAIIGQGFDGVINAWNPAAERLFGYAAAEAIGRPISFLIPPDRRAEEAEAVDRLRRGEEVERLESVRLTKDGRLIDVSLTISAMHDADGHLVGVAKIAQDITERKRAEEALRRSEERTRSIVDNVVDGIITIDAAGAIQTANPAAERTFGYTAAELAGRNVSMLMPEPDRSAHDGYLANYLRTGVAKIIGIGREVRGLRRDGTTFPMELAVGEFRSAGERFFTGVVRDITGRKHAEEELRQTAESMASLSRQLLRAQEDERRRIARELHDEFGQSLTASRIALDRAARDPADGRHVADAAALIDAALEQVRDLSRLLRPSLLDDLGLVEALGALAEGLAARAGLEAVIELDDAIGRLDPEVETACYRIAQEALTNAVKHARATRLEVALRRVGGALECVVADDGVGFDVAVAMSRATHGASLGMLGLRERAALAGGRTEVESRPGGGTRIRAIFPDPGSGGGRR